MKSFCSFLMRDPEHWEDIAHLTTLPTLQTTKGVRNILLVFRWVACVECVCPLHVSVSVYMHCLLYHCDTVVPALWHWGPENTAGLGRLARVCVFVCVHCSAHTTSHAGHSVGADVLRKGGCGQPGTLPHGTAQSSKSQQDVSNRVWWLRT